jgi:hypothetical protein
MRRFALLATLLIALPLPAGAQTARPPGVAAATEGSSQARRPPRVRVYPGGRLLYRDCTFHLAQVRRPDGVFVVPRQYCWWVRG